MVLRRRPALVCTPAIAQSYASGTFNLTIESQFNSVTSSYESLSVPPHESMSFSIPLTGLISTDYGATTITQFGVIGATAFNSTLDAYSYPKQVPSFDQNAYAFLATSDYSSNYITQFGIRSYDYGYVENGSSFLDTQISITKYDPSRGATGSADHPSTSADLVSFLSDYAAHPGDYSAYVFQEWGDDIDNPGGGAIFSDGKSWNAYGSSVALALDSALPEPTTWAMMILGISAIGYLVRRRRNQAPFKSFSRLEVR